MESASKIGFKATALMPILWVSLFVGFVLRAWLKLGYFPRPYHPDPKSLGFDWHMTAVRYLALLALFTLLIFPWARSELRRRGDRVERRYTFVFIGGWIAVGIIVFLDPGKLFDWFLD